jgi:predicted nucleotide-binding protein (sugar kinase/HSP70/actin superfamily)
VVVVIGGVGTLHDALATAVLRARGVDARAIASVSRESLALGRGLLPRGYPSSTCALVGALIETVRDVRRDAPDEPVLFVTAGAHCGSRDSDYVTALDAAKLDGVTVLAPTPAMFRDAHRPPSGSCGAQPIRSLIDAVIVGDALVHLGCASRPFAHDPNAVDVCITASVPSLAKAIVRGGVDSALHDVALRVHALTNSRSREPVRVRITGEFVASVAPGDIGARVVERIEQLGALAQPPRVTDWLLYLLWQVGPALGGLRRRIVSRFRRRAAAAGLAIDGPDDPADLAWLADGAYSSDLRGGAGHLEAGTFLSVERNDLADLVVSVKAFASTPSSSVSDSVLHAIARRSRTAFLAIESTGEGEAHVESRLELAIDLARARRRARTGAAP